MGTLTFGLNVTLDGCTDHRVGIADEETHAHFTALMDACDAMLWGRATYELMEGYWPAVARGDVDATPAERDWAAKLQAKPKYVVSTTRTEYSWPGTHHLIGDPARSVAALKDRTPGGVLLGSGRLAAALDAAGLIDEYRFLVQPILAGAGPTLYAGALADPLRLQLVSARALRCGAIDAHYRRGHGTAGEPAGRS
ncbi:dihydrofolate reductase family protein [Microbacterium excoecariae]|uniref:dihydrofolate reductase family protein n=1 Tax=Microbacterium excoecariae TaxID=2715210 RepID=UPI0014089A46|nr:dihydrofolate reductase family protein [Microbacterium excoecariae]NHI16694.1 deaminase [Microbacterium excoecariae]